MEETQDQTERRCQPRYTVDEDATLVIVNHGATIRGRIFDISLDGCGVRADRRYSIPTPAGIEVMFKLNGIAFRLGGVMQWADSQNVAGIQFGSMAPRRRDALIELLEELEAEEQARASKEAAEAEEADVTKEFDTPPADGPVNKVEAVPAKPLRIISGFTTTAVALHKSPERQDGSYVSICRPAPPPVPTRELPKVSTPASEPAAQVSRPARTPGRDRRAQARHSVDTHATVFFIDVRAQITGRILDLSMSGCRIRTDTRFPVGIYRRVEAEFKLDGLPFRLGGVVQSLHDKFTVGLRFLDLSARKRDQLAQLMEEIDEMRQSPTANPEFGGS